MRLDEVLRKNIISIIVHGNPGPIRREHRVEVRKVKMLIRVGMEINRVVCELRILHCNMRQVPQQLDAVK